MRRYGYTGAAISFSSDFPGIKITVYDGNGGITTIQNGIVSKY